MAGFIFQAKTVDGRFVKGEVEAADETEARIKIRAQKLIPLKLASKESSNAPAKKKFSFGSVDPKELQVFTRQFATLIGSGVPIVQSVEALIGPGRSPTFNDALNAILVQLNKGRRLADALKEHPKIFDSMYVNLVHAGEEGGVLDTVLNRLATYIEKSVKLKGKLKGAMFYPIAVIVIAGIIVSGILTFVIPKFVEIFKSSGMELPWITQKVVEFSDAFRKYWYIFFGVCIMIPTAFRSYYATADGRRTLDSFILKMPMFGELVRKGAIARFTRTLSTMLGAGVRIMEALDISAATTKNWVIEQILYKAKESISKGKTLSEPLKASKEIPFMVSQMISVGEQTGSMDQMLDKVANFYEEEVETTAAALTSMLEPIMMVVLGGIIAVLVVAMYLPIFNLAGASK
jgi:type IV pilus assembly protein PilC